MLFGPSLSHSLLRRPGKRRFGPSLRASVRRLPCRQGFSIPCRTGRRLRPEGAFSPSLPGSARLASPSAVAEVTIPCMRGRWFGAFCTSPRSQAPGGGLDLSCQEEQIGREAGIRTPFLPGLRWPGDAFFRAEAWNHPAMPAPCKPPPSSSQPMAGALPSRRCRRSSANAGMPVQLCLPRGIADGLDLSCVAGQPDNVRPFLFRRIASQARRIEESAVMVTGMVTFGLVQSEFSGKIKQMDVKFGGLSFRQNLFHIGLKKPVAP